MEKTQKRNWIKDVLSHITSWLMLRDGGVLLLFKEVFGSIGMATVGFWTLPQPLLFKRFKALQVWESVEQITWDKTKKKRKEMHYKNIIMWLSFVRGYHHFLSIRVFLFWFSQKFYIPCRHQAKDAQRIRPRKKNNLKWLCASFLSRIFLPVQCMGGPGCCCSVSRCTYVWLTEAWLLLLYWFLSPL